MLAPLPGDGGGTLIAAGSEALSAVEEGCTISSVSGSVTLPAEARDTSSALRLADERLYTQKRNIYRAPGRSHRALIQALSGREASVLGARQGVSELSAAVAAKLGIAGAALAELKLAAELHDIGKLAASEATPSKPLALSDTEWAFVREHRLVGQRILAGAPAARAVGEIVRATNDRWDETGYVDGLASAAIPLAARVIAVCEAYTELAGERSLRPAEALVELRRRAGSQFDPGVVAAFCALYEEVAPAPAPLPATAAA